MRARSMVGGVADSGVYLGTCISTATARIATGGANGRTGTSAQIVCGRKYLRFMRSVGGADRFH